MEDVKSWFLRLWGQLYRKVIHPISLSQHNLYSMISLASMKATKNWPNLQVHVSLAACNIVL